ncbi:hypothetical protein VLK31_12225 [Variovorax sp. H27-G14]|uniref:hypothetical protein n=1 Tax=Variovorax sp. H27-G14 TaxID=3111914 RepID=UPI0038FD1C44
MDDLIGLLAALLFWRVVLATVTGLSVALLLAWVIPAFSGGLVALVTLLSFAACTVWHAAATSPVSPAGTRPPEEKPVARPIAFLGIAVMGAAWGSVSHYLTGSALIAGLLLVAVPLVLGPAAGALTRKPVYVSDLVFVSVALVAGFLTPKLITLALT